MATNNWALLPLIGLGQFRFEMTSVEVAKAGGIYGFTEGESQNTGASDVFDDTKELFGDFFSEEELSARKEYANSLASCQNNLTQTLSSSALVLEYVEGVLFEITIPASATKCNFADQLVFGIPTEQILSTLEETNGAPGRYGSTGAAFDEIAVYLDGFTKVTDSGLVIILAEDNELFGLRTITIRKRPYKASEFLVGSVAHSFR